ncbi:glycosyl transferase family 2 [Pandoraea iniqua]|uniref:Glycosyl transferase family 2 n=1 Tax=Pandoraea iniqua TaxID=2508288 RepID=A0A5E4U8J5_9BURK|nr:glycosyltransferase [Pandoraea iniqua]VVD94579.1 glycosyl transferase family 2 [Pandoraea iniqua]
MTVLGWIAALSLAIWIYLLISQGGFWRARERDDLDEDRLPVPDVWPTVAVIIPARNEAESIGQVVELLCRQDYAGRLRIIVVDDQSNDGTADLARQAAARAAADGLTRHVDVLSGQPLPGGWTGKMWAVRQGVAFASDPATNDDGVAPEYLLHTDADIAHSPDNVRHLVTRATGDNRVLVSLMAKLRCTAWFERTLIPAFVLFFQMLYPFAWVNDPKKRMAAAAGGCMLIHRRSLEAGGGIEAIRDEIIDDCAMGRLLKKQGSIWLGLTERAMSVRPYDNLGEIRKMVSRTAYAQLQYSPVLLAGTIVSLLLTFIVPPALTIFGSGIAQWLGFFAWVAMTISYVPMLRFYRQPTSFGPMLPLVAALYTVFTFDSALQHWRGRGGMWKGRAQARGQQSSDV